MSAGFAADVVTDAALGAVAWSGGGFTGGLVAPTSLAPAEVAGPGATGCVPAASLAGEAGAERFVCEAPPPFARVLNQRGAENPAATRTDRKSTRLNSSHQIIS